MAWSNQEVKALLSIWGDVSIQTQLDGAKRNKDVFLLISKKLQELGHCRDWKQCRCKIKNLKTMYKKVKDHNGVTGNGRKYFKFYQELDRILGHRPASAPTILLDTQAEEIIADDEDDLDDDENSMDDEDNYEISCAISDTAVDTSQAVAAASCTAVNENETQDPITKELPKAKSKKEKKSKGEKVIEKAIDSFIKHQREVEERFLKHEEESRRREMELEERRRKEDQEHEMRLFQMIGQFLKPPTYDVSPYDYEY